MAQKASFRIAKGNLLHGKRPSFGSQKTAFYKLLEISWILVLPRLPGCYAVKCPAVVGLSELERGADVHLAARKVVGHGVLLACNVGHPVI